MAERDILSVWVTATTFLQGGSCQKGSIVCNVIRCKFYTEEIHVIKAVHISEESDPVTWPLSLLYYKHSIWPLPTLCLINPTYRYKASVGGETIWFIDIEWTVS